jgi:hypothetical protein
LLVREFGVVSDGVDDGLLFVWDGWREGLCGAVDGDGAWFDRRPLPSDRTSADDGHATPPEIAVD